MKQTIAQIITNILMAFYQPLLFALLLAILGMFLVLYVGEHGWKQSVKDWWDGFRHENIFRKEFFLVFYVGLILFRTLLNRDMWLNPLSKVLDNWTMHYPDGSLSTEPVENVILFLPYIFVLLGILQDKATVKMRVGEMFRKALMLSFSSSLTIELLQLVLRLGTFQISDLVYNTLGGLLGGVAWWLWQRRKE